MSSRLPLVSSIKLSSDLASAFKNIANERHSFLLDSGDTLKKDARYSFAGSDPIVTFSSSGGFVTINGKTVIDNPVESLNRLQRRLFANVPMDSYLPFTGGLVGYVSFEWANFKGEVSGENFLPDIWFGFYDTAVTYDHLEKTAHITSLGMRPDGTLDSSLAEERIEHFSRLIAEGTPEQRILRSYPSLFGRQELVSSLSKDNFINGVNILKKCANKPLFARHFMSPTHKLPFDVYLSLKKDNDAPFGAFINGGDHCVISSSRTCMIKVVGDDVSVRPTKGGSKELAYDQEIQSSHRFAVADIMQSLAGVCESSSIEAKNVAGIESDGRSSYLSSEVIAKRSANATSLDALLSIIPSFADGRNAGTISRLEGALRSVYTGSIGFIGCNGHSEFNSAFRTLILKDTIGHLHSGTEVGRTTDAEEAFFATANSAKRIFELAL